MNKGGTVRGAKRYRLLYHDLAVRLSEEKGQPLHGGGNSRIQLLRHGGFAHARECSECHRSDRGVDADGAMPALRRIGPHIARHGAKGRVRRFRCRRPCAAVRQVPDGLQEGRIPLEKAGVAGARVHHAMGYGRRPFHPLVVWGDYAAEQDGGGIAAYAESSATLEGGGSAGDTAPGRAACDVDNLGSVFAHGLPDDKASIAGRRRSAVRSAISSSRNQRHPRERGYRVQIIYFGGDDLFLVGNWNDVIHAARDVRAALNDFTGNGVLTISAASGMFDPEVSHRAHGRRDGQRSRTPRSGMSAGTARERTPLRCGQRATCSAGTSSKTGFAESSSK